MRIGFDFDNTIVDYNFFFDEFARNLGLNINGNAKQTIKKYFELELKKPESWKELQLLVYCEIISKIDPSNELIYLLNWLISNKCDIYIVSHKTKFIKAGNQRANLRQPAISWLKKNIPQIHSSNIFFESSELKKVNRIKSLNLDFFVDDLISILTHFQFPTGTKKILFNNCINLPIDIFQANNWVGVYEIIKNFEKK
jgi:uncharacterized HAD superfamily protein